jgi:hypothetical protein
MFATEATILLQLEPFGMLLLILGAAVIDPMALGTFKLDIFTHYLV